MIKISKKEIKKKEIYKRNKIYEKMLELMMKDRAYINNESFNSGLCYFLSRVYFNEPFRFSSPFVFENKIEDLPELYRHKPKSIKGKDSFWWDKNTVTGADKRICIVLEAIMETL